MFLGFFEPKNFFWKTINFFKNRIFIKKCPISRVLDSVGCRDLSRMNKDIFLHRISPMRTPPTSTIKSYGHFGDQRSIEIWQKKIISRFLDHVNSHDISLNLFMGYFAPKEFSGGVGFFVTWPDHVIFRFRVPNFNGEFSTTTITDLGAMIK